MHQNWKEILKNSIRTVDDLKTYTTMTEEETALMADIIARYPLCTNSYYMDLIDWNDPADPIRKMSLPDAHEFTPGGQEDTSGESENTVIQGMQHKYKQTALILSTNQCAMYCRHCFRKRMVGATANEIAEHLPEMAAYVREHTEINNVLISGGDAFLNNNDVLEEYLQTFAEIPTLDFIRFGTRTPVVLPQRITSDPALVELLKTYGQKKQILIITQFNHPRELTEEAVASIRALQSAGCVVRNQTVLLKGVNDDPQTMAQLMNGLVSYGVIPYYIFQCRPVAGVQNQFQVPFVQGIEIVENAKKFMSGQAKAVRFAMSHPTGKIEIVGNLGSNKMLFKYHQAKYEKDHSRIFMTDVTDDQCWLGDIK